MTFTEWYEKTYREEWNEEFASIYSFANAMIVEYENYCKENNVKPKWNG